MEILFYKPCSFFVRLCKSLNYFYENFRRRNFNYIQLSKFSSTRFSLFHRV